MISANHLKTLKLLIFTFDAHQIPYQITGGLAGNIYGSTWPLHDIDIEVPQTRIAEVAELFKKYTVRPLSRFVDEEFDLMFLALRINDIDVEINQVEDAFIFSDGIRLPLNTDLSKARKMNFLGLDMLVQPLDDIIKYKKLLQRNNDVSDLIKLK
ncbi:MAG: nucleotidyltransferase domain-containing protein [Microcoleus sp.]